MKFTEVLLIIMLAASLAFSATIETSTENGVKVVEVNTTKEGAKYRDLNIHLKHSNKCVIKIY